MKSTDTLPIKKAAVFNLSFSISKLLWKRIGIFFLSSYSVLSFAQGPCGINHSYSVTSPSCYGSSNGTINLTVSGGASPYLFNWNNGAVTEDLSGLTASVYTVKITDQNGCKDSVTITLNQPALLTNSIQKKNVLCNGGNSGFILTNVNGGTGPYNYFWSNGFQTDKIVNLTAGTYVVTVVDYRGCSRKDTIQILQPAPLSAVLYSPEPIPNYNVSTYGGSDGAVNLTVSGGTAPYSYLWSNSALSQNLNNLPAAAYSVAVTDSNACTANASIVLDQPLLLAIPSGFTPNGDGQNDDFVVKGADAYPDNLLTIYNRWGNIVYQIKNYSNQWNGYNNKGDELPDGTYFAILEIKSKDIVLKGYVEMKRH